MSERIPSGPARHGLIRIALTVSALALLPACAMMAAPTGTISRDEAARSDDWHDVATEADRQRIRGWWPAWTDALASARASGHAAAVAAEVEDETLHALLLELLDEAGDVLGSGALLGVGVAVIIGVKGGQGDDTE